MRARGCASSPSRCTPQRARGTTSSRSPLGSVSSCLSCCLRQELASSVEPRIVALIMMCTPSTLAFAALAIATGSGLFGMMRCSSVRLLGYAVQSVSVGAGNWFGAAGYSPSKGTYKRADVVLPHYLGPGRHMFLDTAVACPAAGGALNAQPSSAEASGVAASLRADKKTQDGQVCPASPQRASAAASFALRLSSVSERAVTRLSGSSTCSAAMAIVMLCEPMITRSRHPRARPTWRRY